jgi:hypothetical protein
MTQLEVLAAELKAVLADAQDSELQTLSYRNMEKLTLWYHKALGIKSDQLQDTLTEMHANGWRFDEEVHRCGIPQVYFDQFTAAVHGKTVYTAEFFQSMRVQPEWE